jgi:signal transduction histidine kinase
VHRLVQEALHNVVKHAEATHVSISMERLDAETVVVIEGNGRGFDESVTTERDGRVLGLVSMRERAMLAADGGIFESTPGAGTAIFVRIPISARRSA